MHTNCVNSGRKINRFGNHFYIIFTWLCGLILGLHIIPAVMVKLKTLSTVHIPELLHFPTWWLASVLSLLLAIVLVRVKKWFALPFLCLAKSLLLGFSLYILSMLFPSGTWLAALLFVFPDIVNGCLLLWFSLRQGERKQTRFLSDAVTVLLIQAAAICFDLYFIAPFLQKLF